MSNDNNFIIPKSFFKDFKIPNQEVTAEETVIQPQPAFVMDHKIVRTDDPTLLYRAIWDAETSTLNVYLPDFIVNYVPNKDKVEMYVKAGHSSMNYLDIISTYEIDESKIPACKHFVPSDKLVASGSVLPEDWPYDVAPTPHGACSHPKFANELLITPCLAYPAVMDCSIYEADQWTSVRSAFYNDDMSVSIEKTFFSPRAPHYRLTADGFETLFFKDLDAATDAFQDRLDNINAIGEVTVVDYKRPRISLLSAVFCE